MKIIPGGTREYLFKDLTTKQAQKLLDTYGWWFHYDSGYHMIDMTYLSETISGEYFWAHARASSKVPKSKKKHDIIIKYDDPKYLSDAKKELQKELRRK